MSTLLKLDKTFLHHYRENERSRQIELKRIEEEHDRVEDALFERERSRLQEIVRSEVKLPAQIGDRVWCSRFKSAGTIIDFVVVFDSVEDDWYNWCRRPTPLICVMAVIQPDPSPKLKKERPTYKTNMIHRLDDPTRSGIELFSSEADHNEDWDDVLSDCDSTAMRWM